MLHYTLFRIGVINTALLHQIEITIFLSAFQTIIVFTHSGTLNSIAPSEAKGDSGGVVMLPHYHTNYKLTSQIMLIMVTPTKCSPLVGHMVIKCYFEWW